MITLALTIATPLLIFPALVWLAGRLDSRRRPLDLTRAQDARDVLRSRSRTVRP